MSELAGTPVVTCFVRHCGEVLLLRRSGQVGSYRGLWGAVAGFAEGDPDGAARREIAEETGLGDAVRLLRRGEPFAVEDAELGRRWLVHPYLFESSRRDVELDWESIEAAWVSPVEILRRDTVPQLWTSYERVAPRPEDVEGDREHGSAWISLRALEVLRDLAGVLAARGVAAEGQQLAELARRLRRARPSMAAVANRVNRAMYAGRGAGPSAVAEAAHRGIAEALEADERAAVHAARLASGRHVLTLSRSGTVTAALLAAEPAPSVWVAESRPGGEGVGLAEELAGADLEATILPDAAVASAVAAGGIELVLAGADTVLPDGAVINKVGTRSAALLARSAGIPFYAVAARDKVATDPRPHLERGMSGELAALLAGRQEVPRLGLFEPTFEVTPASSVSAVISELGAIPPGEIRSIAEELATLAEW